MKTNLCFILILSAALSPLSACRRDAKKEVKEQSGFPPQQRPLYPAQNSPVGYGIFQKMHDKQLKESPTMNIENPYLLGVEFQVSWSDLQPEEEKFNRQLLDGLIKPWQEENKKVMLAIFTAKKSGEQDDESGGATPQWVFEKGAKVVRASANPKEKGEKEKRYPETNWPVYWDEVYLEKYSNFISRLANQYDGHPALEAIEIGLGNFGSMKAIVDENLLQAYRQAGYSEELWLETMKRIIDLYKRSFVKTPLVVRLGPLFKNRHKEYEFQIREIARYAADKGVWLYQHNLTGTDKWLEKPYAGIFSELHDKTKTLLGPDNPVSAASKENDEFYGEIMTVVENGIGGFRGIPKTHISYMIFYANDVSAATKGSPNYSREFEKALEYVHENLRRQ